jgi:hypothetical protein
VPLQAAKNQCADKHLASEASANVSSLYLALHRSAFYAPPALRVPSPKPIGQKPDQAPRQQIPSKFVAVEMPNLWRPHVRHVSPD